MSKVSVIIPTYNRAKMVCEAVRSVLNQTYTDFEVIVIDDGSTDQTREMMQALCENDKVRYIYQKNQGRSAARNEGIRQARGEYISFLDSDDCYLQEKLQHQLNILESHPDNSMCFTNYLVMDEKGAILENIGNPDIDLTGDIYPELVYFKGTIITTPSVMVRRSVLEEVGMFDETMHICEDLDLWRRIARKGKVIQIKEPLIVIRYRMEEKINWWDYLTGRRAYYKKAFAEDPLLQKNDKKLLFTEMYKQYGLVALRKREWRFAFYCFFFYCLSNPQDVFLSFKHFVRISSSKIHAKLKQVHIT